MNNENELKSKQNNPTLFISFNWINRPLNFALMKTKRLSRPRTKILELEM